MPYPLVITPNGQDIMRINHDASISVLWNRVLDERFARLTELNYPIVKLCEVVLAARDNFVATPWDLSTSWSEEWQHYSVDIAYLESPIPKDHDRFVVFSTNRWGLHGIVRIDYGGSWSMLWNEVDETARRQVDHFSAVAVVGFCRLLMAAKDRFRTVSWTVEEEE